MKKRLLVLGLLACASQIFALSAYMKDSIFVVKGSIRDYSDVGISETIADRSAARNPMDLKVGDIFIDVNGNAQKVTKIERNGKNITIDTETPAIEEVFNCIQIPHQTTDFDDYGEDAVTYSPLLQSDDSRSGDEGGYLLDEMMPEGSSHFAATVNIPLGDDLADWTKNCGDKVDELTKLADALPDGDKKKNAYNNMANQLQNKNTTNNTSANLDITLGVYYHKEKNTVDYDYSYSLPGWNRHGTWKPWKWTWDSGGGEVFFDYNAAYDFGLSVAADLYVDNLFSAPIPGLAYGASSFGPYIGIYFDIEVCGGGNVTVGLWSHLEAKTHYSKEYNALFMSDRDSVTNVSIWSPYGAQIVGGVNIEADAGPAIKVGLVALGMKLVHANASAGAYAEGEACLGLTYIQPDEKGAHDCGYDDPWETKVLSNEEEDGSWTPKMKTGFTTWGDVALGIFARVCIEALGGRFSITPLDYKWPLLTKKGWTNTFDELMEDGSPATWWDTREGQDWINGKH